MSISTTPFTVNGRTYHPPARPIAVICLDGSADEYLDAALARDLRILLRARMALINTPWSCAARTSG